MSELRYAYRVRWSAEDAAYVATALELPSLSWVSDTAPEALAGLEALIAATIADLRAAGEPVPEPLADRAYSGTLSLRIAPSLHQRIAMRAAGENISINRVIAQALAEV